MDADATLLVACLCAQWCGVCRDWRPAFDAIAAQRPEARFAWIDIEDMADMLGGYEPDDFPVLAVQRGRDLVYCATVPQQPGVWLRLIEYLAALEAEAAAQRAAQLARTGPRLPDLRELTA